MFQRYEYKGWNAGHPSYGVKYQVVDSEFSEDVVVPAAVAKVVAEAMYAVIKAYEKKKPLNVAANLALAIHYALCIGKYGQKDGLYSVELILTCCRLYIPGFAKYEVDLQKYLVLM